MIDINKYPSKFSKDYFDCIDNDGYPSSNIERFLNITDILAKAVTTSEKHPIVGANMIIHNFALLNELYIGNISEEEYIQALKGQAEISNDIAEDIQLGFCILHIIFIVHCFALLCNASIEKTIRIVDEKDIWTDFAVSDIMIMSGCPLDIAQRLYHHAFPTLDADDVFVPMERLKKRIFA